MTRPLVLLANDDGHTSSGIRTMRDALLTFADVVLVAPETEQSATSHSLTLHRPLRAREVEAGIFAVDGTPADCVYIALHGGRMLPRTPDVVVSGLNHGLNLGQDVFYSGTVAAAREGALRGIPAIAASAHPKADFIAACRVAAQLAQALLGEHAAGPATLLNLNVPKRWSGGVRRVRLGTRVYDEVVDIRTDPRGREYLWIGGPGVSHRADPGTDTEAYDEGIASITALRLDLTDGAADDRVAALLTRAGV